MSNQPNDAAEIEQAKRNAAIARDRVQTTAGALKQRLNPRNLASDAVETVKEKTGVIGSRANGAAQKRPGALTAAAGVAALIVFRKPLKKIGRRLFSSTARQERRDHKAEKRAAKLARREAKLSRREAKAAERQQGNPEGTASPPDDLIPHAAAAESSAVPVKQE